MRLLSLIWVSGGLLLLLRSEDTLAADIVKCRASNGSITFTQGGCPAGSQPADLDPAAGVERKDCADIKLSMDHVVACARGRGLPVTATWAQIEKRADANEFWGRYVCLLLIEAQDGHDNKFLARPVIEVKMRRLSGSVKPRYSVDLVEDRHFDTPEAAASGACRYAAEVVSGNSVLGGKDVEDAK